MLLKQLLIHVCKFSTSRNKHRKYPLLLMLRILPVVLEETVIGHLGKLLLKVLPVLAGQPDHVVHGARHTLFHLDGDLGLLIGADRSKSDILRRLFCNLLLAKHNRNTVRDHFGKTRNRLPERRVRVWIGKLW